MFWHSLWNSFWHSISHSTWHFIGHNIWRSTLQSSWHVFWDPISYMFWHSPWHSIWHLFWHYICHMFWRSVCGSFWHCVWHSLWHVFRPGGPLHPEIATWLGGDGRCTFAKSLDMVTLPIFAHLGVSEKGCIPQAIEWGTWTTRTCSCRSRSSSKTHITDSSSCRWFTSLSFTRYGLSCIFRSQESCVSVFMCIYIQSSTHSLVS